MSFNEIEVKTERDRCVEIAKAIRDHIGVCRGEAAGVELVKRFIERGTSLEEVVDRLLEMRMSSSRVPDESEWR